MMDIKRLAIALATTAWIFVPAMAAAGPSTEQAAVMATVHQFIDGFNVGDTKSALAACASPASIIDEFPPHEWQGSTACADWADAYNANAAKNGITDGFVTLGRPLRVDITGDRAYAVVPATYTYKQHGAPVTESNSTFTVALKKVAGRWRITGWAWTRR
jgi:hypothetical protein